MQSTRVKRRRKVVGVIASAAIAGGLVAAAPAHATESGYSCISPLSIWGPGNEGSPQADGQGNKGHELIDFLKLKLERDGQPITYSDGQPIELDDLTLTARIDNEDFLQRLWIGSGGKPMIPDVGTTTWPLWVWVAIKGTNTQEGVQIVQARATYDFTVKDPTPGGFAQQGTFLDPDDDPVSGNFGRLVSPNHPASLIPDPTLRASGDETFEPIEAKVLLPKLKWTPTGAGDVQFSIAEPGSLGVIKTLARYTGRGSNDVNRWHRVRPFGSIYVRAETFLYGMNNDCVFGNISLTPEGANGTIPANGNGYFAGQGGQRYTFWGNGSPTEPNFDLGPEDAVGPPPGSPASTPGGERSYAPLGVAGRYNIQAQAPPVIATATKAQPPAEVVALQQQVADLNAQIARLTAPAAPLPARPLTIATARTRVSGGAVTIQFNNSASSRVTGSARAASAARVRVGTARRVIPVVLATDIVAPANGPKRIRLALTPVAQAQIAAAGRLQVRLTVRPTGGTAVTRVVTITRR